MLVGGGVGRRLLAEVLVPPRACARVHARARSACAARAAAHLKEHSSWREGLTGSVLRARSARSACAARGRTAVNLWTQNGTLGLSVFTGPTIRVDAGGFRGHWPHHPEVAGPAVFVDWPHHPELEKPVACILGGGEGGGGGVSAAGAQAALL